ncbi:MAG: HAD hydrolase-like protein [Candidatus Marsarchaeota archaeon]|jgi:phosphoglycolate phosphatase-like HAD superfamily hydrolase|nr:HAD hydrolase-like protein [Candidatus Marsarchaeota archaeon]MCL5419180.1 HAD hydrolase-like protein [Candidatus Marsarchaeota archaeon]
MKCLVIFDLDEVLVKKGSYNALGNRIPFAVNKVFGTDVSMEMFPDLSTKNTRGLTDTFILLKLAEHAYVKRSIAINHLKELYKAEAEYSKRHMREHKASLYKGVKHLLKRLTKEGYVVCLATGNIEPVARLKLRKYGINGFFKFGGFGTRLKRAGIIRDAIKNAEKRYGKISKRNIFYLGDSPRDVDGGKDVGVNTIAVATGKYTMKELAKEKPDYLLKDLSDTKRVMKIPGQC